MSSPRPKTQNKSGNAQRPSPLAQQLPLVSGRWLLWSLAAIFGGGLLLVYLTMVLLFWQGQWQILFHPDRADASVTATAALPFEPVDFDTTETGRPLLHGWFIPASSAGITDARYANETILYLHDMRAGSLSATVPELTLLHQLGVNIFAFDYRGFGQSAFLHPSEETTTADAEAGWQYLIESRHLAPGTIVVYGRGLGASLAAEAVVHHFDAAGLILDQPLPKALDLLRADPRSHWMPVALLAHDTFDPTAALAQSKLPKLFFLTEQKPNARQYATAAADPKRMVYLPSANAEPMRIEALRQFLDELPSTPPSASSH